MKRTMLLLAVAGLLLAGCQEQGATTQPAGGAKPGAGAAAVHPVAQPGVKATRGVLPAVIVAKGPPIDGTLNSPIWQKCPPLTLGKCASDESGPLKTTARLLFDATNLYVAWECLEPDTAALKVEAAARDADAWNDDSVELFISADPRVGAFHFAINSKGVIQDWKISPDGDADLAWNSAAVVKAAVEKDKRWIVTMSVPLKELGAYVGENQTWPVNLNRTKPVDTRQWVESSWSADGHSRYVESEGWGKITGVLIVSRPDGVTRKATPAK